MTRLEVPIPCDLTLYQFGLAVQQLVVGNDGQVLTALVVHPYAKHQALSLMYESGWRVDVVVDETLTEDEWVLRGTTREIHSPGA
jgi:hypothetical protein